MTKNNNRTAESGFLTVQGRRDFRSDLKALEMGGIDTFPCLDVLDVGCSDGSVSYNLLEQFMPRLTGHFRYTGVEVNVGMCEKARDLYLQKDALVLNGDVYEENIQNVLKERGPFNLIILSHVIMHVSYPEKLLNMLHGLLSEGGLIYIKAIDDDMKVCHPHEEELQTVIRIFQNHCDRESNYIEGAHTDRFVGRKIYGYLKNAGYNKINQLIEHTGTVGKDLNGRMEEYDQFASYRTKQVTGTAAPRGEEMEEMLRCLEILKKAFETEDFYYSCPIIYFTAGK